MLVNSDYVVCWNHGADRQVNVAHLVVDEARMPVAADLEDLCQQAVFEDLPDGYHHKYAVRIRFIMQLPPCNKDTPELDMAQDGWAGTLAPEPHDGAYRWEVMP